MTEQPKPLLTIPEAAELLRLSVVQVRRYVADGSLLSVRFGRRAIRIKPADLERFIEERTKRGQKEASDGRSTPRLAAGCPDLRRPPVADG